MQDGAPPTAAPWFGDGTGVFFLIDAGLFFWRCVAVRLLSKAVTLTGFVIENRRRTEIPGYDGGGLLAPDHDPLG
jgi:hypothetical protein